MVTQLQLPKDLRREQIMSEALKLVKEPDGWLYMSINTVAERCDCSARTVTRLYKNHGTLVMALIDYAELMKETDAAATGRRIYKCGQTNS